MILICLSKSVVILIKDVPLESSGCASTRIPPAFLIKLDASGSESWNLGTSHLTKYLSKASWGLLTIPFSTRYFAMWGRLKPGEWITPQQAGGHLKDYCQTCLVGWSYLHESDSRCISELYLRLLYHQHCGQNSRRSTTPLPTAAFSIRDTD